MIIEQQKTHEPLDGEHAANDQPVNWAKHHEDNDKLHLKHPSNRSKKDEQKRL